jgi:lycopene beta-cyclase
MNKVWDIVIVGGGLGGLSLATELASPQFAHLSVLVLEKRKLYMRDRTWSYWTGSPHRYSHLERQRWNSWKVSLGAEVHIQKSEEFAYATIDADVFYDAALQEINGAAHIELRMDCAVLAIDKVNDDYVVNIQPDVFLQARTVLDARPTSTVSTSSLVQQFEGWQVNTEHDVFDPICVELMAFEPHPEGLHFWYVLPYSRRCALVESTWISPASWKPDFEAEVSRRLNALAKGKSYSVDYKERGILSLQNAVQPTAKQPIGLGRLGGTLRPATGYAFLDTLSHASQLASSLAAMPAKEFNNSKMRWQPAAFVRPMTERWMDTVFLKVLARDWRRAPNYFMQMFETVNAQTTVNFLTGKADWSQRLQIMRTLPTVPFAKAAISHFANNQS